jgi:hypothetical protein
VGDTGFEPVTSSVSGQAWPLGLASESLGRVRSRSVEVLGDRLDWLAVWLSAAHAQAEDRFAYPSLAQRTTLHKPPASSRMPRLFMSAMTPSWSAVPSGAGARDETRTS